MDRQVKHHAGKGISILVRKLPRKKRLRKVKGTVPLTFLMQISCIARSKTANVFKPVINAKHNCRILNT